MTSSADLVREMIEEMADRVGAEVFHRGPERVEELWIEVDSHLRAADLSEISGDFDGMAGHFATVNDLLGKIVEELPD